MQDKSYDKLTLLGIAYESGFNSKSTFNRIFREVTGKSPAEYKKERPNRDLGRRPLFTTIISEHQTRNFMFRNYLKIAWRNLLNQKFYSALNIPGLTVGLTVGMLVIFKAL